MAIFHLAVKVVSRGSGHSAIAKAAYNARVKLQDERTGHTKDYSRLNGLSFSGIFAPKNAPAWASDRQQLWNAVERREDENKRAVDAQLARQIVVALPFELTGQQREWLVKDYVREQFTRKGMVADVNIHEPSEAGDERNHHAHILLTMREIGPAGFGKKVREWNSREQVDKWRAEWEKITNRHLERHGHAARIDRRSLAAQGIEREPTRHRGSHMDAIARRENEADADELAGLRVQLAKIERDIRAEEAAQNDRAAIIAPEPVQELPAVTTEPRRHVEEKRQAQITAELQEETHVYPAPTSRADDPIPRREPKRTAEEESPPEAPREKTILDEIRQWSLCKTFVHQFKLLAERIIPILHPVKKRKKKEGDGGPWHQRRYRAFTLRLKRKPPPKPPPVVADLEAEEHRTAEELTRPAHTGQAIFSAFSLD